MLTWIGKLPASIGVVNDASEEVSLQIYLWGPSVKLLSTSILGTGGWRKSEGLMKTKSMYPPSSKTGIDAELEKNVISALDAVPLESMRRFVKLKAC